MNIKNTFGVVLLAIAIMVPVSAQSCEGADPLSVSFYCFSEGGGFGEANATVSGGVSPYSYSWSISGGSIVSSTTVPSIVYVGFYVPGTVSVNLAVTDSCGNTRTISRNCYIRWCRDRRF